MKVTWKIKESFDTHGIIATLYEEDGYPCYIGWGETEEEAKKDALKTRDRELSAKRYEEDMPDDTQDI